MQVDHVVDERNDPFYATRAAGQLMAYNYSITGNWPMAITAYNHGLGGVRRAMREYGDTAYVDILRKYNGRTFGFASRNFYVAFLAAKEVDQNVEKYFPGLQAESPIEYSVATYRVIPVSGLTRRWAFRRENWRNTILRCRKRFGRKANICQRATSCDIR